VTDKRLPKVLEKNGLGQNKFELRAQRGRIVQTSGYWATMQTGYKKHFFASALFCSKYDRQRLKAQRRAPDSENTNKGMEKAWVEKAKEPC